MKLKISFRILVTLTCLFCSCWCGICSLQSVFQRADENNVLQIVSMNLTRSAGETNFTVTATIQNTGSNDITDAELNLIFIKDNDIVDSEKQPLNLVTGLQRDIYYDLHQCSFRT